MLTRAQKVATMVGSLLGLLLAALDQTIVATAAPKIQSDLHIEPSLYVWLTTAYLVASTVLVPVWGKLSDLYGRKPILITGMAIFLLGSALCGIATETTELILFRAVQGVGSASLFTNAFAVVADLFPPAERGKYQGIFGGVFGISSVVGPLAGGFITDHFSWHWVFFVNLPIGAIAFAFVGSRMPMLRRPRIGSVRIDLAGALALVVGIVPMLLALSLGKSADLGPEVPGWAWGSWQILGLFAISAVGLILFVVIEGRAGEPILDLRLFGNKVFAIGNVAAFVMGLCFLGAIVFLPLFMVRVVGLSATNSGLTTTPLTFGIVAGNITSGQLVSRTGRYKPLMLLSIVIAIGAFAVMGWTLTADASQLSVSLKMILVGLGIGPSIPLYTLAIQNAVPPQQIGVATSSATFFRQMGATIGVAILGTVFATSLATGMKENLAAATVGAPPEMIARMQGPHDPEAVFDAAAIKKAIADEFAARADAAPPAARAGIEAGRDAALATIDRIDHGMKQAFTDSISLIYRVSMVIGLVGLLITLTLPELPLRKGHGPPPAAVE